MKPILFILSPFFLFIKAYAQDSSWKKIAITNDFSCMMPFKAKLSQHGNIYACYGEKNRSVYQAEYNDSSVVIPNSDAFKISLEGFVSGVVAQDPLTKYNVEVTDTLVGNTRGLFAKFKAGDSKFKYQRILLYATIANHKYYWFFLFTQNDIDKTDNDYFWNSIKLNSEDIPEKDFILDKVHLERRADE